MNRCKYCGSELGVYTKVKFYQYYNWDGMPDGVDVGCETKSIYCQKCDKRIGVLSDIEPNKTQI